MDELLARCKPLVKSLIRYRRADQYLEANELANLVYVKLWRSVRLSDESRGSPFSFVARVTSSVLASAIGAAWAFTDRYTQLDTEAVESVFAPNGAEAVEDLMSRVRSIKTPLREPNERSAQRWLVESFIDCGFCIRRHQAANAMEQVYGTDHV